MVEHVMSGEAKTQKNIHLAKVGNLQITYSKPEKRANTNITNKECLHNIVNIKFSDVNALFENWLYNSLVDNEELLDLLAQIRLKGDIKTPDCLSPDSPDFL